MQVHIEGLKVKNPSEDIIRYVAQTKTANSFQCPTFIREAVRQLNLNRSLNNDCRDHRLLENSTADEVLTSLETAQPFKSTDNQIVEKSIPLDLSSLFEASKFGEGNLSNHSSITNTPETEVSLLPNTTTPILNSNDSVVVQESVDGIDLAYHDDWADGQDLAQKQHMDDSVILTSSISTNENPYSEKIPSNFEQELFEESKKEESIWCAKINEQIDINKQSFEASITEISSSLPPLHPKSNKRQQKRKRLSEVEKLQIVGDSKRRIVSRSMKNRRSKAARSNRDDFLGTWPNRKQSAASGDWKI
jgi:hypothetical protein